MKQLAEIMGTTEEKPYGSSARSSEIDRGATGGRIGSRPPGAH